MSTLKIISESPITMVELKNEIKKIKKRDEELNFRAQKTDEYLQQFSLITKKQAEELDKKLTDLEIPRLKPVHICKIIDIMPTTPDEAKLVLQGYTVTVSKENMKRISDVVKDFTK